MITCWKRADLLTLLCSFYPSIFVTFPYGVSGQVRYLIVSIPDLCLLLYLRYSCMLSYLLLNVSLCGAVRRISLLSFCSIEFVVYVPVSVMSESFRGLNL